MREPLAYFITFHTYGTWLHGHEHGSVTHSRNRVGEPRVGSSVRLRRAMAASMVNEIYQLDRPGVAAVDAAIREVCRIKRWALLALHVRTTHVHAVVSCGCAPETAMRTFKAWASRRLREVGAAGPTQRVWSRHGSTRWITSQATLESACGYTLYQQGAELLPRPG
ncbi:MAG: hypothetical protein KIT68_13540 [Phycisphaeraceae bacterium]|nr:hypothetical protein [Phycisphaeraceae bacterium]